MIESDLIKFYFSFKGRATRYDFNVKYALPVLAGSVIAGTMDYLLVGGDLIKLITEGYVSTFWNILMLWPTIAVTSRRLHDLNYSGWWQALVGFVIIVPLWIVIILLFSEKFNLNGELVLLITISVITIVFLTFFGILTLKPGTKGPNKYGPDPLEGVT